MGRIKVKIGKSNFEVELAKTIWQKAWGLMFSRKIKPMLFEFGQEGFWNFHTFFMLKIIDFVFISADRNVVDIIKDVKPFRIGIRPRAPAKYVVELPAGESKNIKVGQKLE